MRPEDYIRHKIRQLLVEERLPVSREKTKRIGGGVRQEFRDLKARSKTFPSALMKDLGVGALGGRKNYENLHSLVDQAVKGNEIMAAAYSKPEYIRDEFNRRGVLIKVVGDIASRDGVFFVRHTVRGAKNAKLIQFNDQVAIELLGNDVVVYVAKTPYSWNTMPTEKEPSPEEEKKPEKPEKPEKEEEK